MILASYFLDLDGLLCVDTQRGTIFLGYNFDPNGRGIFFLKIWPYSLLGKNISNQLHEIEWNFLFVAWIFLRRTILISKLIFL